MRKELRYLTPRHDFVVDVCKRNPTNIHHYFLYEALKQIFSKIITQAGTAVARFEELKRSDVFCPKRATPYTAG